MSQRSVSCFPPFSHSPSAGWNWGVSAGPCHIWNLAMQNEIFMCHQVANCPVFCTCYGWHLGAPGYELCIVMLFARNLCQGQRKPTHRWSSQFLVSLHVGTHPTISSLQAAELMQSLATQMPLQVSDQHFPPQNLRVCNRLLILFSVLSW